MGGYWRLLIRDPCSAKLTFPATADNWKTVMQIGVDNALKWSGEGWSGVISVRESTNLF